MLLFYSWSFAVYTLEAGSSALVIAFFYAGILFLQ